MAIYTSNRVFNSLSSANEVNDLLSIDGMTLDLLEKYDAYCYRKMIKQRTGRTASTDSMRSKVYEAEFRFQRRVPSIEFSTFRQAERYLNKVLKSKTWEKVAANPKKKVWLAEAAANTRSFAGRAHGGGKIELHKRHGMNEYTLLHEMAHQAGHWHHDVGFRQCVLKLVSRFMGRDAAKVLKEEFKYQRLKLTISDNIQSPEAWLKSYFKMKAVRSVRMG